jgi:hypothetical protein
MVQFLLASYWQLSPACMPAKLLLSLPSTVLLVPSPTGLMTIFYCLMALVAFRHSWSTQVTVSWLVSLLYSPGTDCIENTDPRFPPLLTDVKQQLPSHGLGTINVGECFDCHGNVSTGCCLAMDNFLLNYSHFQLSSHNIITVLSSDLFWHVYEQHRYSTYHDHDGHHTYRWLQWIW